MDEVFNGLDADVTDVFLDDGVVSKGDALVVDLSVTSFVDQFSDSLQIWVSPGDVRLASVANSLH